MASGAKRQRYTLDEAVGIIFDDGSEHGGMDSGEESELDRELENFSEELSEPEGGIGEVRECENVEKEDEEDPDWIEGEGTEVSTSESEMENENTDDDVSVEPVPSTSHAPGMFYNPARSRCPPRAKRVPASRGTRGFRGARGARAGALVARGSARGRGGRRAMTRAPPGSQDTYKSYDDEDEGNPLDHFPPPPFTPERPSGIQFQRLLLRGSHRTYAQADGSWKDVIPDEIHRLIALLIYFGLVKVGMSVDRYWSTKSLYHGLWARSIMSRTRFLGLMALLHVVDAAAETPGDKLRKVQSFVNHFKSRCVALYQPRKQVAIDERMVKSRHRSGIRQYVKEKPTKWGIKLWVLADSCNGYTIDFNIYIGKDAARGVGEFEVGHDVVVKLIIRYNYQGYHLCIDNFYTSVHLMKHLFQHGVLATGTILDTRRDFPANLKNGKQWGKGKARGTMRWQRDVPCLALQWVDNKVVSMITTSGNANDTVQVNRKTKSGGVWSSKEVPQPLVFAMYNKYMNAVDRSDQMLATHNVQRKCMRWWKTLFFHLIDIAVVNSFILFREHQKNNPDDPALRRTADYSLGDFREEVIRGICGFPDYDNPPVSTAARPPRPAPQASQFVTEHIPVQGEHRRNCVVCYREGRGEVKVQTYCSAPQCEGRYMHVAKQRNCFAVFHSAEYHLPNP
ncbi:PREDICTED: piggyBac transposable element-derived protein 3-like [Acropora digitifera]|uniref:piggyBac transposable element-derived protein 3-like n=1 Tax=Acropora digitifera TaxID=70779 RepID=UPI00077A056C|nr:PREDICTED: piggyBac transposable element-derived protein 3-like [Acropora digitifera]